MSVSAGSSPARRVTALDALLSALDTGLRALTGTCRAQRPSPASGPDTLSRQARRRAGAVMRVNHCGEICAQALYQGQALTTRNPATRRFLLAAGRDEEDHLAWCRQRLRELGSRPSLLDPPFYGASFLLGAIAGGCGDRASLAFLEATEQQVGQHLTRHLRLLPEEDVNSRTILAAMRTDEERHRQDAERRGGTTFPPAVKRMMGLASRAMTETTYRI